MAGVYRQDELLLARPLRLQNWLLLGGQFSLKGLLRSRSARMYGKLELHCSVPGQGPEPAEEQEWESREQMPLLPGDPGWNSFPGHLLLRAAGAWPPPGPPRLLHRVQVLTQRSWASGWVEKRPSWSGRVVTCSGVSRR